jgi:hypothetical protein
MPIAKQVNLPLVERVKRLQAMRAQERQESAAFPFTP